jgi:hypothetical protein
MITLNALPSFLTVFFLLNFIVSKTWYLVVNVIVQVGYIDEQVAKIELDHRRRQQVLPRTV